jgi:hypothetical protein
LGKKKKKVLQRRQKEWGWRQNGGIFFGKKFFVWDKNTRAHLPPPPGLCLGESGFDLGLSWRVAGGVGGDGIPLLLMS